jgi:hypothetical protein
MNARGRWWQRSIGGRIIVLFLGCCSPSQVASFMALRASLPSMRTASCRKSSGRRAAAAEPARPPAPDADQRRRACSPPTTAFARR